VRVVLLGGTAALRNADLVFGMTGALGLPGGIASANLNLLMALQDLAQTRQRRLRVFSYLERDDSRPDFLEPRVSFTGLGGSKTRYARVILGQAWRRPLFIFDHVGLALPTMPLARTGLARTVIFAHGWEYWKHLKRSHRFCLESATLNLANSNFTLERMRAVMPHARIAACLLGLTPAVKLNASIPERDATPIELVDCDGVTRALGDRFLLLVARLDASEGAKGHYPMLAVLPEILRTEPSAQLVFAGGGSDRDNVARKVRELGLGPHVFLPGHVPVPVLEALYRNCYAFVMPSTQEGFGLVYLEAMNFGKACLGCSQQGTEDVIVPGVTGYLVSDPAHRDELAGSVIALLAEPARTRSMGLAGFRRLHDRFTSEQYQHRVTQQIDALL
jgi:glycosyltransferase involved in cell wall biosynthesis